MRYVGNVRNVVLCNVTTEKRSVPYLVGSPMFVTLIVTHRNSFPYSIVFHYSYSSTVFDRLVHARLTIIRNILS